MILARWPSTTLDQLALLDPDQRIECNLLSLLISPMLPTTCVSSHFLALDCVDSHLIPHQRRCPSRLSNIVDAASIILSSTSLLNDMGQIAFHPSASSSSVDNDDDKPVLKQPIHHPQPPSQTNATTIARHNIPMRLVSAHLNVFDAHAGPSQFRWLPKCEQINNLSPDTHQVEIQDYATNELRQRCPVAHQQGPVTSEAVNIRYV